MARMIAAGCVLAKTDGIPVVVALGDTLRLKNGFKVRAHFWTERGVHGVIEKGSPSIEDGMGLRVAAFDVGDGDIEAKEAP